MKKITGSFVSGIIILLSALFAFLLFPGTPSFPFTGVAFFFIMCALFFFYIREKRTFFDFFLFLTIILLSLGLIFRAQPFLIFLNIITLLFISSIFILSERKIDTIRTILFSPITSFYSLLATKPLFSSTSITRKVPGIKSISMGRYLPQILLTFLLLLIVIPLLSYANPVFADLTLKILKFFDLTDFINRLFGNFPLFVFRLIFFSIFLFFLPRLFTLAKDNTQVKIFHFKELNIKLIIPKIVLGIVLLLFFMTQIQFYLASPEFLQSLGYTNSQHTREVFAQLGIVAFIIFLLVYGDRTRDKWSNRLTTLLVIQGIFLTGIALKSVYDYTALWGLTHKRLYGYAGVTWIFGSFLLFAYFFYKKLAVQKFLKYLIMFTAFIVVSINVANFDYLIYHFAKPTVFGIDHEYLARLSPDANHYKEHVALLTENMKKNPSYQSTYYVERELRDIEYLRKKYSDIKIGAFNYSEYKQYLNTKNINIESLRMQVTHVTNNIQKEEMRKYNEQIQITPLPSSNLNIQQ